MRASKKTMIDVNKVDSVALNQQANCIDLTRQHKEYN